MCLWTDWVHEGVLRQAGGEEVLGVGLPEQDLSEQLACCSGQEEKAMIDWVEQPCGLHLMKDWHMDCPICRTVAKINQREAEKVAEAAKTSEKLRRY